MFDLHGKNAIITGTNTGLGQGMCVALAKAGADIVGVGRSDMTQTQHLVKKTGVSFLPVFADLMTLDPIDSIIEKATATFGKIDILINNAGIIRREDAIDYAVSDWDDVMNTNITLPPKDVLTWAAPSNGTNTSTPGTAPVTAPGLTKTAGLSIILPIRISDSWYILFPNANNTPKERKDTIMFKHEKMLFHPVEIERPNPQYAALLQEQLGGGNGELKAAMQYMSQSFRIKDPAIKDLFLDIAAEELGHMEMVAQTINLLNGHDVNSASVPAGEIQSHVLLGLNPGLINSSGYSWTADYVTVTGDLCADLLSNIASEQRAKVVYEYLYRQINDKKVRETIDFLLNREEAHNAMFREAFNKVQNTGSNQDFGTTKAAKMYFSMSEPSPAKGNFQNTSVNPVSFQ